MAVTGNEDMEIRLVAYCPHCGNRAPQRLIHIQYYSERTWSVPIGKEELVPWSTFLAVCETCDHLLLYDNPGDQLSPDVFNSVNADYP